MRISVQVIDKQGLWKGSDILKTIFNYQDRSVRIYNTGLSTYIVHKNGFIEYQGPESLFGKSKYIQFVRKQGIFGARYYVRLGALTFEIDPNSINKELFDRLLTTKDNTT